MANSGNSLLPQSPARVEALHSAANSAVGKRLEILPHAVHIITAATSSLFEAAALPPQNIALDPEIPPAANPIQPTESPAVIQNPSVFVAEARDMVSQAYRSGSNG